ncbi:MAG: sigma-70 family RNA polymerase sigma factor, partial [Planctomycetales bacterium]|nr:sigma-70 family RNA polymerase sigma factor [Planctomycetales bacterium]
LDFEIVLRNTQARIRAYIAGMGIAPHEVDDVAQDVYLEFYRNQDKVPADISPQRWLKGIARNVCLNHIRRAARRGRLQREALAQLLAAIETDTHRQATEGSLHAALEECCRRLPEDNQQLLRLRYTHALSAAAIADRLEKSAEAVRTALFRVRASLKQCVLGRLAQEASHGQH